MRHLSSGSAILALTALAALLLLAAPGCPRPVRPAANSQAAQEELVQRREALRQAGWGPETDGLMLLARLEDPPEWYEIGDPIVIELRVRNVGLHDRYLPVASHGQVSGTTATPPQEVVTYHYDLHIRRRPPAPPDQGVRLAGWKSREQRLGRLLTRVGTPRRRTLPSWEFFVRRLNLQDFHGLLEPGAYEVVVEYYTQPFRRGRGARAEPLTVLIGSPLERGEVTPTPTATPTATPELTPDATEPPATPSPTPAED